MFSHGPAGGRHVNSAPLSTVLACRTLGTPVNCNRGEAKHQELKRTMVTCSRRPQELLRHLARQANDALAVEALAEGLPYKARVYMGTRHEWESRNVAASDDCASVVGTLLKKFEPGERDEPRVSTRRPRGGEEWMAVLSDVEATSSASHCLPPPDPRNRFLPDKKDLIKACSKWFGCTNGGDATRMCDSGRCLSCGNVTREEVSRVVKCRNWVCIREAGAPEHSKGTVLRGSNLGEWTRVVKQSESPIFGAGGSDVEFGRDENKTVKDGTIQRPLVRILLFFEHRIEREAGSTGANAGSSECTTVWLAGLDYVKLEPRGEQATASATELPRFFLKKTRMLYPVEFLEHVFHMVHACSSSFEGRNRCQLEGVGLKNLKWKHNPGVRQFLMNNYYERGSG